MLETILVSCSMACALVCLQAFVPAFPHTLPHFNHLSVLAAIVMLLRNLHEQAKQHGGAVYMLNGNHESLNVCGDFRYVEGRREGGRRGEWGAQGHILNGNPESLNVCGDFRYVEGRVD